VCVCVCVCDYIQLDNENQYQFHHRLLKTLLQFGVLSPQFGVPFIQSQLCHLKVIHGIVVSFLALSTVFQFTAESSYFL